METEIKILLTSDMHLGILHDDIKIPNSARINTFKKITTLARNHDILLIAGDLIDSPNISSDIIDVIKAEFTQLRNQNIEIIYTPGRGEVTPDGGLVSFLYDLPLSHIFLKAENAEPFIFTRDNQTIYFYGIPPFSGFDISKIRKIAENGFHMGLFHVDFDMERNGGEDSHYKLQKQDLKNLGLDFYALGHRHNFKLFKIADKIIGAYPGTPEATSFNETGDRYAISMYIKENAISQIRRLAVNTMKLHENIFNCEEYKSLDSLYELLNTNKSKKVVQRIVFSNYRTFKLDYVGIKKYETFFYDLQIVDQSFPSLDLLVSEFENEDTIRGEFFRIFKNFREKLSQNDILNEIDIKDMAETLHMITNYEVESLEEWLCNLLSA
jgi:DNA repair exonuclease SbcCD nuclease subunit